MSLYERLALQSLVAFVAGLFVWLYLSPARPMITVLDTAQAEVGAEIAVVLFSLAKARK